VIVRTVVCTVTYSLCVLDGSEMRMPSLHWREKLVLDVIVVVRMILNKETNNVPNM